MSIQVSTASIVWLILTVVFLLIEAMEPGLTSIWLAAGSVAALIPSLLKAPFWVQLLVFVAVSAVSLILTRPLAKRFIARRKVATNADAVIGKECIVTERIDNVNGTGAVKTGGKVWTARSVEDGRVIEPETRVIAMEIKGVKLIVKPLERAE